MNDAGQALEQIRRTELAAAQMLDEARHQAEQMRSEAKAAAARAVDEGRRRGVVAAEARLRDALEEAERQAADIGANSASQAKVLVESAQGSIGALIEEMVAVVLAPPSERGK